MKEWRLTPLVVALSRPAGPKPGKEGRLRQEGHPAKNSAIKHMDMENSQTSELARASSLSHAQRHRPKLARNGRRLPYHERLPLKKIAHRRGKHWEKKKIPTLRAMLNMRSMTGRGHEIVDFMERRKVKILCVQETKWGGEAGRRKFEMVSNCSTKVQMVDAMG